jgi:AsmA protein
MGKERGRLSLVVKILGIAAVLLIVLMLLIPFFVDANQFRPMLNAQLSNALGREVKVGNLALSLFTGSITADEITIADDPKFGSSPFVRAQSLHVGIQLRPLIFSRTVNITAIMLDKPEVSLVRTPAGVWNFASIGSREGAKKAEPQEAGAAESALAKVSIASLSIKDGRVTVNRGAKGLKPYVFDKVNIAARDLAFSSQFPFSASAALPGGGSTKLEGKAGPLNRADMSLTPFEAAFGLTNFDLLASGFVSPSAGLAGLINLDCSLASDGKQARTKGQAHAEKLKLAKGGVPSGKAITLDYSLHHDLKSQSGVLDEAKVTCDRAITQLSGRYDISGNDVILIMKLRGKEMPVQDLAALLPAAGVILPRGASLQAGTLNIDASTEGSIESLVTTGSVDLSKTRLEGYDLGSKIAKVASLAGFNASPVTDIEKLASGVRVTAEGIRLSEISLDVPSLGQLAGNGIVNSDQSLDFKMVARLKTTGSIAGGLARLAGGDTLSIPFLIQGTAEDPKFVPDLKGAAGSLLDAGKSGSLGKAIQDLFGKKK